VQFLSALITALTAGLRNVDTAAMPLLALAAVVLVAVGLTLMQIGRKLR
jgi:hypothetical protein